MRDIRMFIREDTLYLFDRSATRLNEPTSMLSIRAIQNKYEVKATTENLHDEETGMLEDIVVNTLNASRGNSIKAAKLELPDIIGSYIGANATQIDTALSTFSSNSNVDRIMRDVLLLDYKERTDLVVAILDLL